MIKMKLFTASFLLLVMSQAFGQKYENLNNVKINYKDSVVTFFYTIKELNRVKKNKTYYWYKAEKIHSTVYGYSGYLLDGEYVSYYSDGQLKTKGYYKMGRKQGIWKTWDKSGIVLSVINYSSFRLRRNRTPEINKLEITK